MKIFLYLKNYEEIWNKFLNKLHKDEKHQTQVSLSLTSSNESETRVWCFSSLCSLFKKRKSFYVKFFLNNFISDII